MFWFSASLVILGDGSERDRLQQIVNGYGIDDKVEFKGHVAHDEVFQELTSSDFFLFFSNKESERLPNVVKEAMLAGCIVLVSYTIGIDELVTDKVNGYIVDPANISEINSIITDVVCSRELLCGVSGAARDVIINRFNIEDSMRQYIDKWDNLVND